VVPRILVNVLRSPSPPVNADGSVRLVAALLPAAALLFGAAAPSSKPARVAVYGLAVATLIGGPLIAILGAPRRGLPQRGSATCDLRDDDPRHDFAPNQDPHLRPAAPGTAGRPPSITILVPARNEAHVIGALISDLGRLRGQPPEVVVIDDGSDDGTGDTASAAIAAAGVTGWVVRRSRGGDGKGRALAHVAIGPDPQRMIIVLDADARVDPGFGDACRAAATGAAVGTARRRMLRPNHGSRAANILARLQDDEQSLDDVVQRARLAVGGAAEFRGNGMLLRADVLAKLGGWPIDAVCEDLELSSRLYQATGRGVERPPGLIVWEQPVIGFRALFSQRLRWAEGSIRRDLRIVLPQALRGADNDGRALEPLAYAGQALVPWVAVGLAGRCLGSRRGTARRGLAALLGAYGIATTSIAWATFGALPGERLRGPLARALGSAVFACLWFAVLPIGWLRVLLRPEATRFAKTIHAPATAFSEPEPTPSGRT
jgi:hypothetical protein